MPSLYNEWYVSAEWSDVGPSTGSRTTYQEHNADKIYSWAKALLWTDNAIAGMIGNMQVESGIDPACSYPKIGQTMDQISNAQAINYPDRAYGLVQWKGRGSTDPANNQLVGYAIRYNAEWYDGDIQLQRLEWEYTTGNKFHAQTVDGIYWTFGSYAASTATPEVLAKVWMVCYEGTYSVLGNRQNNARDWYNYFGNHPPVPEDWVQGDYFAQLALNYDGQYIPYSQCDCIQFVNMVWQDISQITAQRSLTLGTNSIWRSTRTFPTTDPMGRNPTPELWYKGTLADCISRYGNIPTGTLLFHKISDAGPPAIPPQYAGDGIGNFVHVGIYCGNGKVMQSGGQDSGSIPGGGVHKSDFDPDAWNYAAFVVYVEPSNYDPPEPPEPGDNTLHILLLWYNNNRKELLPNVIHGPV